MSYFQCRDYTTKRRCIRCHQPHTFHRWASPRGPFVCVVCKTGDLPPEEIERRYQAAIAWAKWRRATAPR